MREEKLRASRECNFRAFATFACVYGGEESKEGKKGKKAKGAEHVFARVTSAKHVAREKRDAPVHRGPPVRLIYNNRSILITERGFIPAGRGPTRLRSGGGERGAPRRSAGRK